MARMFLNRDVSIDDFKDGVEFEVDPELGSSDDSFDEEEFNDFKDNLNCFSEKKKLTSIGKIEVAFNVLKESMEPVTEDKLVLKQILKNGTGLVIPDKSIVMLHYEAFLEGQKVPFDSTHSRRLPYKFLLGNSSLVPGLELGIQTMKRDEIARILVGPEYAFGAMGCPPRIPGGVEIVYEVEILNFFPGKSISELEDMSSEEQKKISFEKLMEVYHCEHQVANDFFGKKAFKQAIAQYRRLIKRFEDISVRDEEEDERRCRKLLRLYLNIAQCYINVQNGQKALIYSKLALRLDPENTKGLYRMGIACTMLDDYERAEDYLNRVKHLKPYDTSVNAALKKLELKQKQHSDWERVFCRRMMGEEEGASSRRGEEEEQMSPEMSEFRATIEAEVGEFLRSDLAECPFSPGHTEEELEVIQAVARRHNLAFISKIQFGEKITKLAKRRGSS